MRPLPPLSPRGLNAWPRKPFQVPGRLCRVVSVLFLLFAVPSPLWSTRETLACYVTFERPQSYTPSLSPPPRRTHDSFLHISHVCNPISLN